MASTFSTDLSLELVTTGEKAGLWGTITNTNLQLLQQAVSGYVEVTLSTGTTTLLLSDGSATANGKNLYIKVVGTASIEAPATAMTLRTGEVGVITWNEIIPGATMVWTPIKPYG